MSINVTTAFVQQYSANVQMLSQQMGSLLRDAVRVESVTGKNAFFDRCVSIIESLPPEKSRAGFSNCDAISLITNIASDSNSLRWSIV